MRRSYPALAGLLAMLLSCLSVRAQQPFAVGTASAAPGQKTSGYLEVPAGVDAATSIPVAVVNGVKREKTLALVSEQHVRDKVSIIAIKNLIAKFNPAQLTGTVILVQLSTTA